eukprot:4017998-Prymnesium_polylepis.1
MRQDEEPRAGRLQGEDGVRPRSGRLTGADGGGERFRSKAQGTADGHSEGRTVTRTQALAPLATV